MKKLLTAFICITAVFCLSLQAQDKTAAPAQAPADDKTVTSDTKTTPADTKDTTTPPESKPAAAPENPFGLGMSIGTETIDDKAYMVFALQPDLNLGKFGIGLDIILRLSGDFHAYKPDWNSWDDILGKINYVRWGLKGEPLFVKVGLLDEVYLGHGSIFYRFSNKLFLPDKRRIGVQFDLDLKKFGFELFDDDLLYNRIVGGRIYYRPFAKKLTKEEQEAGVKSKEVKFLNLNKWAIGVTGAADIKLKGGTNSVFLAGADLEMPILDLGDIMSFMIYVDYVKNFNFSGANGSGLIPGFLFTLFGFNFVGEYHLYQKYYNGPYFDTFYDIERKTRLSDLRSTRTNVTQGWSVKMSRDLFGYVKFAFDISDTTKGDPAMHFEAIMLKKIAEKVSAGFAFDRINIASFRDAFSLMNENASANANILYSVSKSVDLIFTYQWSFVRQPDGSLKTNPNFSIQTKFALF